MTKTFSFELFNKETYDKEGYLDSALYEIIPEVQVPYNYLIDLMYENFNEIYVPVFQKELDNKSIALEEYTEHCDYLPFEKFREKIESKPFQVDGVANVLEEMERHLKENKYYIIPFIS